MIKEVKIYKCDVCKYSTERKSSYTKHLITIKHKRNIGILDDNKSNNFKCCKCNKLYNNRSGLWKHEQKCIEENINDNDINNNSLKTFDYMNDNNDDNMTKNVINEMINYFRENEKKHNEHRELMEKQLQAEREQCKLLINTVQDMIPKIGNYNNNNININVFLEERCKDALNLKDFVASLQIELHDLLSRDRGMIDTVGNIFVNGLRQLDLYKRPIHCTDLKMEKLYIKDDGEWDTNNTSRMKLHGAISEVAAKQSRIISEWEKAHPNWEKSEKLTSEYLRLVKICTHPIEKNSNDENKIIHNIAKEVVVDINKIEY